MSPNLGDRKIILVIRRTRLDELVARFNTEAQARFYVEHSGADFGDYQREDRLYKQAVAGAEHRLRSLGRLQILDRSFLPNFIFGPQDTVVALGQDGLVANVLKYLDGQPLLGVNPDVERFEGVLLPFTVADLDDVLPAVFAGTRTVREVTMAEAVLNNGERLCGVNDLFIGPRTHTSARYRIRLGKRAEQHSSSGVIVSTGLGSTGWLRSIVTGAAAVASAMGSPVPDNPGRGAFPWEARHLIFSVREPWPSTTSGATIAFGRITPEEPLIIESRMPDHGVIFSDGIQADFLPFNSGTEATISLAGKTGRLVR